MMDIGKHCMECRKLDFLPFECHKCGMVFCVDHRMHDCKIKTEPAVSTAKPASETKSSSPPQVTTRLDPSKSQSKVRPQSQSAKAAIKPTSKNAPQKLGSGPLKSNSKAAESLEKLKQMFRIKPKKTASAKAHSGPTAQQKRDAVGDSMIPPANRVYLLIERLESQIEDKLTHVKTTRPSKSVWMYFDKKLIAGRLLDRASQHLGVANAMLEIDGEPVDLSKPVNEFLGSKIIVKSG